MEKRIINEDGGKRWCPIRPENIDSERPFCDGFDHRETEISAKWIVRFMQNQGRGWISFTLADIEAFYSQKHNDGFCFNRLVEPEMVPPSLARAFMGCDDERVPRGGGWIVLKDGRYYVTNDFIVRCYNASPVVESPEVL